LSERALILPCPARPDFELWPGGEKVGLALWNYPVPEQLLEIGLIAVCGAAWVASRKSLGRMAWPAIAFIGFLLVLQAVPMLMPGRPPGPLEPDFGVTAIIVYLVVVALAALTDLRGKSAKGKEHA